MGWSGYSIYDGDGTFSCQMDMIEKAGYADDAEVPLRDGRAVETWILDETDLVADEVLAKVYRAYPKIVKKLGIDGLVDLNAKAFETKVQAKMARDHYYEEDVLVPLTMVADFFLRHGAAMPGKLQQNAVLATKLLLASEHTQDFDEPALRKRELRKHMGKLERFKPKLRYTRDKIAKVPVRKAVAKTATAAAGKKVAKRKP